MSLFFRNLLWLTLLPGTVTGLLPYFVLSKWPGEDWGNWSILGGLFFMAGLSILLWCVYDFALVGKGTPSPVDPAKNLVVKGLYRFSRNPMYIGVITMLAGETLLFGSLAIAIFVGIMFLIFNLFIRFYEEPYLRKNFGEAYREYCEEVNRWVPGLRIF